MNICQHYWLAEAPNGPKTRMVCKWCTAVQYLPSRMTDEQENKLVLYRRMIQGERDD